MFLKIAGGKVLTPSGTINANVIIKDGVIEEITGSPVEIPDAKVYDAKGMSVVPGVSVFDAPPELLVPLLRSSMS